MEAPAIRSEAKGRDSDQAILSLFPDSTFDSEPRSQGEAKLSQQFSAGKSLWKEGLDETKVFHGEMIHAQEKSNSFSLRMGKGGQIYSLRGPFGESVPPSWRKDGAKQSPWNDEVWQFVAVCTKYNGFDHAQKAADVPEATLEKMKQSGFADSFFVHNSGAYIDNGLRFDSLYCPLLSAEMDQAGRCFRMLNWGLVPQTKTIHRSPILFYTQVRDAGDGVIELTWVVHNFSVREDVVFDHLNAPGFPVCRFAMSALPMEAWSNARIYLPKWVSPRFRKPPAGISLAPARNPIVPACRWFMDWIGI